MRARTNPDVHRESLVNDAEQSHSREQVRLLVVMAFTSGVAFAVWRALLNNFAVERAGFTGWEMGVLQSLREVPGFLAFAVVFLLLLFCEQTLAYVSLVLLGVGVAVTGWFPSATGMYVTTVVMSIGFHYYETVQSSLSLQWIAKSATPEVLGRLIAVGSIASLAGYAGVWLAMDRFGVDYRWVYLVGGAIPAIAALVAWRRFPRFAELVPQHRSIVLRRRYWLFYALTFMSGARRQIFVVFAGFLLVERFGYSVGAVAALYFANAALSGLVARRIGRWVGGVGERRALQIEYTGLILVFCGYAFVSDGGVAGALYVVDHLFFALAIAIKTYFQKIADPRDIASTASVGFTINHIAAVVIPVLFGGLWLISPAAVFLAGAAMAVVSFGLSMFVPRDPAPGHEVAFRLPHGGPVPSA